MFNFLPALIQGGMGILSGLMDPKSDNRSHNLAVARGNRKRLEALNKREIKWNREVEAKARGAGEFMMAEAEKLGINPITYLQAGGLSHAYNVATVGLAKPAFQTYVRPEEAYQSEGMTTGQAFGKGLEAFGNSAAATMQQEAQNAFTKELLEMQLVAANARGNGSGYSVGGVPTAHLFSDNGASHVTSGAGGSGHVVPGQGSMLTRQGSLYDMGNYDRDAGDKIFGPMANDFMEPAFKAKPFFENPKNRNTMEKLWDDLDDVAGWGVEFIWRKANEGLAQNAKNQQAAQQRWIRNYGRSSIGAGKANEDAIFNPGFW